MSDLGTMPVPSGEDPTRGVEKPPAASPAVAPQRSSWETAWLDYLRDHFELPLLAALGATFGFLTGMGLWSELHTRTIDFALWAACLGLAAYVIFDPAMDLLYEWLGAKRPEFPEGRKKAATVIAAVATILVSAFHHSLDISFDAELASLEKDQPQLASIANSLEFFKGWGLVVVIFLCIGLGAWLITQWWARGARYRPPRAAQYGAAAAVLMGLAVVSILIGFLAAKHLLSSRLSMAGIAVLGLLWFVGPGFLGGLAINKRLQQEDGASPTRGIIGHLAVFSLVYVILLLIVARAIEAFQPSLKETVESYIWLPIAALISQNLGWALAPYFRREFCDRVLAPAGTAEHAETAAAPERTGAGAAVLEIPRRGGALVGGAIAADALGGAALAAAGEVPTAAHARDLLLKPRGDRLWATIGLVLSLATSVAAYHLGTLRKDPDISANVAKNFQQDSGLESSRLNAQSSDHVVTLTGYVASQAEHQAALQKALAVRGVKQVIDQIQVAPPPPSFVPLGGAEADGTLGAGAVAPAAEINANVSLGAGKPAAEPAAKPAPAKVNAAKSPAIPKSNAGRSALAKTNAAKPDEAKADKPASHNPLTAVKNAFTKTSSSSGTSDSATSAKPGAAGATSAANNTTQKSSKNPFSFVKNKIKKPKTSN